MWHALCNPHTNRPEVRAQYNIVMSHRLRFRPLLPILRILSRWVAGMVAGLAQTLIITPVDLLKIRQQIQTSLPGTAGYVGPLQLLATVVRHEGVTGRDCRTRSYVRPNWTVVLRAAISPPGNVVSELCSTCRFGLRLTPTLLRQTKF